LLVKLLDLLFVIGIVQVKFVGESNYRNNEAKTLTLTLK